LAFGPKIDPPEHPNGIVDNLQSGHGLESPTNTVLTSAIRPGFMVPCQCQNQFDEGSPNT